jgi:hypothetical protein
MYLFSSNSVKRILVGALHDLYHDIVQSAKTFRYRRLRSMEIGKGEEAAKITICYI